MGKEILLVGTGPMAIEYKKVLDELRPYFFNIINYEKSIFDIIINECK